MIGKKINQLATELAPVSTDLTIIGDPISGVSKKITLAQLGAIFSGAVSFYTNLAGFPATGDINVIYCAKDTQKLYLWSGSAYVEVFPSQALLDTYQLRSEKGVSNGYASLDSTGKVPISQLPSSIMEYKGTWNAATNTPTLANGTGDTGDVYICNVAGTVNFGAGPITFAVGDYTIYSGSIWQRSSGAVGTVTSVALSRSGDALAITGSPITTSGTINIGFAGTGAQYIKGDGTLATFPNTISQAEKLITEVYNSTGATLTKGTIVYINGGQGNLPTVTKALATGDSTSAQTFGVVQADITNMNNGYVVVAGKLSDLDTQAYTPGTQLYLSSTTAGTWTSTKQYAPNHLVYIGIVVRAHPTQGIVEVKIQNGYELDELHNVAAQTPTNNDGLFWEASTSLWKNKSIATILGYTPQAQLNGTGFVKASGTTITYDNSTYLTTSAAATTYLPLVLSSTTNVVDINGQQFNIYGSGSGFTSGRIIIDPVFSAIGYQNAGVFDGLKILTNGNAEFSNSGVTRFFNQVRFDSTLTNGTYTYTLPGATGTIALTSDLTGGTVTSVGLSSATSGVTIGSTPITTSGTITLAIATASGSQQGLLSSTDWTTFNNKQNALTNPVTGTGTTNYLPKFTGTSTIGNSQIFDTGSEVRIFTTSTDARNFTLGVYGVTWDNTLLEVANDVTVFNKTSADNGSLIEFRTVGGQRGDIRATTSSFSISSRTSLIFGSNNTDNMRLDASGNLGLGVTPSAWNSGLRVQQIGYSAFVLGSGSEQAIIGSNWFQNTSASNVYLNNGFATFYQQVSGTHQFFTAPSGTAGNAISFTQAMTLNASGFLGIGETNPTSRLHIQSSASGGQNIRVVTSVAAGRNYMQFANGSGDMGYIGYGGADSKFYINNQLNDDMLFVNNGATRLTISSTGAATFSSSVTATNVGLGNGFNLTWGGAYGANIPTIIGVSGASGFLTFYPSGSTNGEAARFTNNGNFGIGTTSPGRTLHVLGQTGIGTVLKLEGAAGTTTYLQLAYNGATNAQSGYIGYNSSSQMQFFTNDTLRATLDASGNLGLGVNPSSSTAKTIEVGFIGNSIIGRTTAVIDVASNTYFDSGYKYANTAAATLFQQNNGIYYWFNAPSGTAGNAISFTQAMTLNASGNLSIGNTNDTYKLDVSGTGRFIGLAQDAIQTIFTLYGYNAANQDKALYFRLTGSTPVWTLTTGAVGTDAGINILPNGNAGLSIAYSGAATFSSSVQGTIITATSYFSSDAYRDSRLQKLLGYEGSNQIRMGSGDGSDFLTFFAGASERMRITSGGGVGIGKTASVTGLDVYYADTDGVNSRSGAAAGPSRSLYTGWHSASGTTSGTLSFNVVTNGNVTNTNNSYGSLSDIKLKENIIDTTPKLADLLKVRIVNYNLIGQESKQIGVIAQELETIFPSMIEEYYDKDAYGNDLKTKSKGVKYSVFVPMLIKAVQELKAELDTLKNK